MFSKLTEDYLEPVPGSQGQLMQIRESLAEDFKEAAKERLDDFQNMPVEIQQEAFSDREFPNLILTLPEMHLLAGLLNAD